MNLEIRRNFVNLTPHTINIRVEGHKDIIIEPSGTVARVETKQSQIGELCIATTERGGNDDKRPRIPVDSREWGEVQGIPVYENRTRIYSKQDMPIYLVSALVLGATNRDDVAAPDTGETAIRNEAGHIVAVTRLIMNKAAMPEDDDHAF